MTDATRIERAAGTLKELAGKGARVVVLSHFGRPKGKVESSMSLRPIADALKAVLGDTPVAFAEDCVGEPARKAVDALDDGQIVLLENLRFHKGEEGNDPAFAGELASLGELYVNDAFSCSHRAHASVVGVAELLPAYAGRLMQAELQALETAVGGSARPAAALIGGAKISSKLEVLGHLLDRVDALIIGGGMANTFLHAEGLQVGKSLNEPDLAEQARAIVAKANEKDVDLVLPIDATVASKLEAERRLAYRRHRRRWRSRDDSRRRPQDGRGRDCQAAGLQDTALEWATRRFRGASLRQGDGGSGSGRGQAHEGRKAHDSGRRWRYRGRAASCGRSRVVLLRLDSRRRLPGMAGGQGAAGRRSAAPALSEVSVVIRSLVEAQAALDAAAELGLAAPARQPTRTSPLSPARRSFRP